MKIFQTGRINVIFVIGNGASIFVFIKIKKDVFSSDGKQNVAHREISHCNIFFKEKERINKSSVLPSLPPSLQNNAPPHTHTFLFF